jgi:Fic family protein
MKEQIHTLYASLDWELLALISKLDRFDASWATLERKEGVTLKELKSIATVRSVAASTRIEGSQMSDGEVDTLIHNLNIDKLENRDAQEVAGYFETMELISGSYNEIEVTESNLKSLHKTLLKHSIKDEWHRGDYKQHSNAVEARLPDGTRQIIFRTTEPGFPTEDAMRSLVEWYANDKRTHPLVKCAVLSYEFVSIHPFQDGNGRMSRLIPTLVLLQSGYSWIQYISFEHEIEHRKTEYYKQLRKCQEERPAEDITSWIHFFFDCLLNIQGQLLQKLQLHGAESELSIKEKSVLTMVSHYAGIKSGEIARRTNTAIPTVKRILAELVNKGLIQKHGAGRGTYYVIV